ncbi:MAG: hypothetical protein OXF25_08585 [Cyanobacteria bacterium MAG CAR3_bin_5]|nr:hypothetical protein [Cyanobacteria bacterium MAG CAR3_bin_5]
MAAACRNILSAGLAERLNACGAERLTDLSAAGREAGTRLNQGPLIPPVDSTGKKDLRQSRPLAEEE